MFTLKKNYAQTLTFLSFACEVCKKKFRNIFWNPYIHVENVIMYFFILQKAKRCHCIEK